MKTVFLDIDTQFDFLHPAGALYAPGAENLPPNLLALTRYAAANRIPLVSTVDAHSENDPEFRHWKPHCVKGTAGYQKSSATLLPNPYVLTSEPDTLDRTAASAAAQIIVEKQHVDCFTNPNLRPLLALLGAERYVIYGLVTEVCVLYAVRGLARNGAALEVVSDAIQPLNQQTGEQALEEIRTLGACLITTADIVQQVL